MTAVLADEPLEPVASSAQGQRYSVLIEGGRVLDGTGNPWFVADVALDGDRIAAIGELDRAHAERVIDATGKLVVPGFIDLHSHADEGDVSLENPDTAAAANLVTQGITTVVVGQDGRCRCPVDETADRYTRQGIGPNVVQLVGHGTVRRQVMGRSSDKATPEQIEAMVALTRSWLEQGAAGLSSGLEYVPGRYGDTDEVIALARVTAEFGGFYISHQRSEGLAPMWWLPTHGGAPPDLFDAVEETIRIGEAAQLPVVASHVKVKGATFWGAAGAITRRIRDARARGIEVYADQYPYATTGSDGNTVLIPRWVWQGGDEQRPDFAAALATTIGDPEGNSLLRRDIAYEITRRGGAERLLVLEAHDESLVGLTIAEIAATQDLSAVDVAITLQAEGLERPGGARIRGFSLDEEDVEHFMAQEFTATCTDGGVAMPGVGWPHPRYYGTYPRKLRRYALERGVQTLADAVRSSTTLPAQIAGLAHRGRLAPGFSADVAVLDLDRLMDHAEPLQPHQYSTGVETVLVNGELVVDEGAATGALPGRVLTGTELHRRPASERPS